MSRLSHSFGISDTVLAWFTSCFSDCTQFVSANGSKSLPAPLQYGVPQGSVLRPILFVLYTQPPSKIIQHHYLFHNSFSDDSKLYICANLSQLQEIIRASKWCISDVQTWIHNNKLPLNPDKTGMILISKHNQKSLSLPFCRSEWNRDSSFFNCPRLGRHPRPEFLFSSMSHAPVKTAILNCVESMLSVTTCHKMLSKH